jgi:hypothetical protein
MPSTVAVCSVLQVYPRVFQHPNQKAGLAFFYPCCPVRRARLGEIYPRRVDVGGLGEQSGCWKESRLV